MWELLSLETQLLLIQRRLVDPGLIGVDREAPKMPRLFLMESREELERIMKQTPRYCIFQPALTGLRSPKVKKEDME